MIDLAEGTREVIEVSPEGVPEIIEVSSSRAGRAAIVAIGVITTGAPGTSASVTNSGTAGEAVLDFTIPTGENVELRINGGYIQWKTTEAETWNNLIEIADITATIDIGTVTTGAAGTSVTFVNAGSGKDAIFNLSIPRGTTFTPSVSAEGVISFTNDGGLANPSSVDITGPQGIQGEIGPQGPQGVGVPTINTGDAGKFLKVNTTETDTEWTALPEATDTVKGIVELATPDEVKQGTDNERAVTPAGLLAGFPTRLRSNLLGTVSQTGGVPTGAVIESGSNANGSYVKFADGTMVCWATGLSVSGLTVDVMTNVLYTFPVVFSSLPSTSVGVNLGAYAANYITIKNGGGSPAKCNFNIISTNPTYLTVSQLIDYHAIGRWF